jgi:hypothetical protein
MIQALTAYQTASGTMADGDKTALSKPLRAQSTVQASLAPIIIQTHDQAHHLRPTIKLRAPRAPSNTARDPHNLYSFLGAPFWI